MTERASGDAKAWIWTLVAATAGWGSAFVFSGVLQWPRSQFLLVHATVTALVVLAYTRAERVSLGVQFTRRWRPGAIIGLVFGAVLVRQVISQPASARPDGVALLGALAWDGVAYGVVDALLLSVIPVLSLYGARSAAQLATTGSRFRWALLALLGSAVTAALYHLGFAEFRGATLLQPVIGNLVITLSYLLAGNPVAPVLAHVMMHVAAVLHGMETTSQLPPHY